VFNQTLTILKNKDVVPDSNLCYLVVFLLDGFPLEYCFSEPPYPFRAPSSRTFFPVSPFACTCGTGGPRARQGEYPMNTGYETAGQVWSFGGLLIAPLLPPTLYRKTIFYYNVETMLFPHDSGTERGKSG
jgi:hypothetical protein